MRIPSQFDDQSLYRKKLPRSESIKTFRKLIRLALGLALVIVVMLEAAKPGFYRPFFGHLPAKSGGAAVNLPSAKAGKTRVFGSSNSADTSTMYSPKDHQIARQLVSQLSREEQVRWTVTLSRALRGLKIEQVPDTTTTTLEDLIFDPELTPTQRDVWEDAIDNLDKPVLLSDADPQHGLEQKHALLDALDEAAANRVIDGSVWRSADFDSFYRTLDAASQLPATGIAAVGALPLLQQPDVFLNQAVAIHGNVALAEKLNASENPYGIKDYWQLWIKPAEGADRPIVVCVPDVPRSVVEQAGKTGAEKSATEGLPITVVGRFLKRLAYRSGAGADLAPVVVGRITYAPYAEGEQPTLPNTDTTTVSTSKFWLLTSISCIGGIALAMLLMWRTSVLARESRNLRTANRQEPDEFLKGLGEQSPNEPSEAGQEHP